MHSYCKATKEKEAVGSVERIFLPRLNGIDGKLKTIGARIEAVNSRIDEMSRSVSARVDTENVRIDEMDMRKAVQFDGIRTEIRGLSEKVYLVRDVGISKVEVAELKRRRQAGPDSPRRGRLTPEAY